MLEVKNLKKIYKSKGGVVVNALDGVSLVFPEKGMVFLLGKSGSGKSTLLNVIGGLDKPTSGEIIIKGKNSKDFSGADFDSYRNTFIGFIFQEYNILNEFTIEQNISLALQLQGKKNDKSAVEAILEQVDLKGYGSRKPNTISGGQKQRIAIARALIKNPEIIMADEPTGALDSKTGKQVFDTLKKLSKDKLIIVVSHDRDFAEIYGDRIIELFDGKVISDVTKKYVKAYPATENVNLVNENAISIKDGSKLSKEDMDVIYNALRKHNGEVVISSGDKDVHNVKQVIHINSDNTSEVFNDTTEVETKEYDPKNTKFIRSRLPFSRVLKMGASSLKTKPFKLIFTAFLTAVSLTMFGVTSTLMLFKENYSISKALQNSRYVGERISKTITGKTQYIEVESDGTEKVKHEYNDVKEGTFSEEELAQMNGENNAGLKFSGIISFGNYRPFAYKKLGDKTPVNIINEYSDVQDNYYYPISAALGGIDHAESVISANNFSYEGSYPTAVNELMITKYQLEKFNYIFETTYTESSIQGVEVTMDVRARNNYYYDQKFVIKGVVDVGEINEDYLVLKKKVTDTTLTEEEYKDLREEFPFYLTCSYHDYLFVGDEFYDTYKGTNSSTYIDVSKRYLGLNVDYNNIEEDIDRESECKCLFDQDTVQQYLDLLVFTDINGNVLEGGYTVPQQNEVYMSLDMLYNYNIIQTIYGSYFSKLSTTYEYRNLSLTAKQYIEERIHSGEDYYALYDSLSNYYLRDDYPDGRNRVADIALAADIIDNYYVEIATRRYVTNACSAYIYGSSYFDNKNTFAGYEDFYDAYNSLYDENGVVEAKYQICENYIKNDPGNVYKYTSIMNDAYRIDINQLTEEENERLNIINGKYGTNYSSDPISEDEFNFVENLIKTKHREGEMIRDNYAYDVPEYNPDLEINDLYVNYKSYNGHVGKLKVIGYFFGIYQDGNGGFICNDDFLEENAYVKYPYEYSKYSTDYEGPMNEKYAAALSLSDFNINAINYLRMDRTGYYFGFTDSIYISVYIFVSLFATLKTVFLWIGVSFGIFAALMLLNFISNSITNKMREIGILRALGARGSDVFKIFFTESGIVAAICTVVAIVASWVVCWRLNVSIYQSVGIYLLDFSIISIGLIIAEAIVISLIGTFMPVAKAAKKPPVDSIRSL